LGGVNYNGPVYVVDPEELARKTVQKQCDASAVHGITR
jgi:hypothetical protein